MRDVDTEIVESSLDAGTLRKRCTQKTAVRSQNGTRGSLLEVRTVEAQRVILVVDENPADVTVLQVACREYGQLYFTRGRIALL